MTSQNPFLFMLGCQRSGTTLLQHILDSHPDTTVMQEAGWVGTWYEQGIGMTREGLVSAPASYFQEHRSRSKCSGPFRNARRRRTDSV